MRAARPPRTASASSPPPPSPHPGNHLGRGSPTASEPLSASQRSTFHAQAPGACPHGQILKPTLAGEQRVVHLPEHVLTRRRLGRPPPGAAAARRCRGRDNDQVGYRLTYRDLTESGASEVLRQLPAIRLSGTGRRHGVVEPPPEASYKLLEPVSAAPALDYDTSIRCRPQDNTPDVRLPGERSEAVPYRRLEGVAELVAPTPAFDIDQLVAVDSAHDDPVDAPASSGAAAERNGGDRRATPLELGPHVVAREQFVSTRPESRLVDPRCLAAGGRPTGLARGRLALRARPRSPPARDVECRRLRGCSTAPREPASRTRRRTTRRAPLIEPQSAIAHRDPLAEQNGLADDVMLLCSAGIGRTHRSAGDQPGRTKVSPGNAPMRRRWFSVHIPSTSFTSAGFRPPRPFTQTSGRFAGISCPPVSVCERSKHPCPSMVRKGSSVRVRQRALRFWLLRAIYWFLELTFVTALLRPYLVHGRRGRLGLGGVACSRRGLFAG